MKNIKVSKSIIVLLLILGMFMAILPQNVMITHASENSLTSDTSRLPKLSENSTKEFLGFIYNDYQYSEKDNYKDSYYKLLTGDYSDIESEEELYALIWDFSTLVRTSMNKQVGDTDHRIDVLTDDLVAYLMTEIPNGDIGQEIIDEYKGKAKTYLANGIEDILSSSFANKAGVVISGETLESIHSVLDGVNQISDSL